MRATTEATFRPGHRLIVPESLIGMDPIDREVLTLRYFEHRSHDETALVLVLTRSADTDR